MNQKIMKGCAVLFLIMVVILSLLALSHYKGHFYIYIFFYCVIKYAIFVWV